MQNTKGFLNQQFVFILSIVSLLFAIGFSLYTVINYQIETNQSSTMVGSIRISLSELEKNENLLIPSIQEYESNALLRLSFQNKNTNNLLDYFEYDNQSTIQSIQENKQNPVIYTISNDNLVQLEQELENLFGNELIPFFNIDQFITDITTDLFTMPLYKEYQMEVYLDELLQGSILNTIQMNHIPSEDINMILQEVNEIIISKNGRFSLLDNLENSLLNNTQLSMVATGILQLIFATPFSGISRLQYIESPSWTNGESDVRILRLSQVDFSFYNDFNLDYHIEISKSGSDQLIFQLIGYPFIDTVTYEVSEETILPFETIENEDDSINELTENVVIEETDTTWIYYIVLQEGVNGYIREYSRTFTSPSEEVLETYFLTEYLFPQSQIIYINVIQKGE